MAFLVGDRPHLARADLVETDRAQAILIAIGDPVELSLGDRHSTAPTTVLAALKTLPAVPAGFLDRPVHCPFIPLRTGKMRRESRSLTT